MLCLTKIDLPLHLLHRPPIFIFSLPWSFRVLWQCHRTVWTRSSLYQVSNSKVNHPMIAWKYVCVHLCTLFAMNCFECNLSVVIPGNLYLCFCMFRCYENKIMTCHTKGRLFPSNFIRLSLNSSLEVSPHPARLTSNRLLDPIACWEWLIARVGLPIPSKKLSNAHQKRCVDLPIHCAIKKDSFTKQARSNTSHSDKVQIKEVWVGSYLVKISK